MDVSEEELCEFERLFLEARDESRALESPAEEGRAYKAALAYAREHGIHEGEILLHAVELAAKQDAEGMLRVLDFETASPIIDHLRLHDLARALADLRRDREAIQIFESLVDIVGALLKPRVQANLGIGLLKVKEYDSALEHLTSALKDPLLNFRGHVLSAIGIIHAEKGDFPTAVECLERALEDTSNPMRAMAWNNLGKVYEEKGEFKKAEEAYRQSTISERGATWVSFFNLGRLLHSQERSQEAETVLKDALAILTPKEHEGRTRILTLLGLVRSRLSTKALSGEDRAVLEAPTPSSSFEVTPEQRMLTKLAAAKQSKYDTYLQRSSSDRNNLISILRGWSSAVTLLEGSERLWRGGGYFLKWRGLGICIDPGFDFLSNLHDAGHHGRELDAVIVSHNHPDHNADLVRIDDLRYELYKRRASDPSGGVQPYLLIWDADSKSAVKFSAEAPEHQLRPMHFDLGRANPMDRIDRPHSLPIEVEAFEVRHGDLRNAVGFRLRCYSADGVDFTLGYTGDTEYFEGLSDRLAGCDLLIAHISQPDPTEFTDPSARKRVHLGYRGAAELIKQVNPKLTLIGEFWAGLADLRIDLVQGLRQLTGTSAILPAGLGLHISVPNLTVECSECMHWTLFSSIRVAPPSTPFGNLAYLCERCLLQ